MRVEVLKDATLEVKAGQTIEISEKQFETAVRLGLVAACTEKPAKRKK